MIRQKENGFLMGQTQSLWISHFLFESKLQSFVDKIIVVSVTPEIQKQRLM